MGCDKLTTISACNLNMVFKGEEKIITEAKELISNCLKCEDRESCSDKCNYVRFLDSNSYKNE